ncbi:MAG: SDR family oxidoreductase [Proteobacteria bacterium]|nr:SDR family oxidoreductase [Pseudomonadota bacterium]HQR05072.1 SDR family oxidoreductase [Rhodocyclaceae bacterium]
MSRRRFEGKAALITGAASGIGLATTERLAREGARILACDINAELLDKEVARLAEQGLAVFAHSLNVTHAGDCSSAVEAAVARFGRLDFLGNIAGTLLFRHFTEIADAEWSRVFDINVNGPFYLSRAALPHLEKTKGNIVNISSAAGVIGVPYNVAYSASKGAVLMMTKALAVEYGTRGVRVNVVCPGHVHTPMTAGVRPPEGADLALFGRLSPIVLPGASPAEIAASIAYLASDEARFVTGSTFVIDGGQTAI